MPLVEMSLVEGRAPEQIRTLIDALTEAVEKSIGVPRNTIAVIVREVPATSWADGGMTIAERRAAAAKTKAA